jgi:hypothetical protein
VLNNFLLAIRKQISEEVDFRETVLKQNLNHEMRLKDQELGQVKQAMVRRKRT